MIVPFRVIDKLGTWWDERSDFDLGRHAPQPVLYWHGLREGELNGVRAGTVDVSSFKYLYEGLYAEWDLWDNEAGNASLRLVDEGVGATSTGTMGHYIEGHIRKDGYVEKWPLVEVSMLDVKAAGSQPGTTTVYHIRASGLAAPGDNADSTDEIQIIRSQWIMDNVQVQPDVPPTAAPVAPPPPVPQPPAAPLRQLPGMAPAPVNEPIRVASRFDHVSALGLLLWDAARRGAAARNGLAYTRTEEFMRALGHKIEGIWNREQREADEAVSGSSIRAIDGTAAAAWGRFMPHLRANELMGSTVSGYGDELVPTAMSSVAYHSFMLETRVAQLFEHFELPSVPYTWPTIKAGLKIKRVTAPTDQSQMNIASSVYAASRPATGQIVFTPGEIGALSFSSQILFEDAGVNVADAIAKEFARRMAAQIDYVILNGDERADTNNISHLGADPSATDYNSVLVLDGLRRIAGTESNTVAVATLDVSAPITLLKKLGARGILGMDRSKVAYIMDPGSAYVAEALTSYQTVQNVGPGVATLLNGPLPRMSGVPIVVSDEMENATTAGAYPSDHSTGATKGHQIMVHTPSIKIGYARQTRFEAGYIPHTGGWAMSGSVRLDLQLFEADGVALGYNTTI